MLGPDSLTTKPRSAPGHPHNASAHRGCPGTSVTVPLVDGFSRRCSRSDWPPLWSELLWAPLSSKHRGVGSGADAVSATLTQPWVSKGTGLSPGTCLARPADSSNPSPRPVNHGARALTHLWSPGRKHRGVGAAGSLGAQAAWLSSPHLTWGWAGARPRTRTAFHSARPRPVQPGQPPVNSSPAFAAEQGPRPTALSLRSPPPSCLLRSSPALSLTSALLPGSHGLEQRTLGRLRHRGPGQERALPGALSSPRRTSYVAQERAATPSGDRNGLDN